MSNMLQVPELREYVAAELHDYCDGLGHLVTVRRLPSGEVLADVEQSDGSFLTVYVDTDGSLLLNDRYMRPVQLRGFRWHAQPTDTGRYHGPEPRTAIRGLCEAFDWREPIAAGLVETGIMAGPTLEELDA